MSSATTFFPPSFIGNGVYIDRNWSCRPGDERNSWKRPYLIQPCTFQSLTQALSLANRPFVAISAVGPSCYRGSSTPYFKQIEGHPDVTVYGYGSEQRIAGRQILVFVCGVQQKKERTYVYYVLANDVSPDREAAIGVIAPLRTDQKVYVTSLETFAKSESDMFPPVSEEEIERKQNDTVVPTIFAENEKLTRLYHEGKVSVSVISQPED